VALRVVWRRGAGGVAWRKGHGPCGVGGVARVQWGGVGSRGWHGESLNGVGSCGIVWGKVGAGRVRWGRVGLAGAGSGRVGLRAMGSGRVGYRSLGRGEVE